MSWTWTRSESRHAVELAHAPARIGFAAQRWKDGTLGEMLHQTSEWAEPRASTWPLDRMLQVARGDTLEYRCRYRNTTDERILVGESAKDEMCMLVGYYVGSGGTLWGFPGSRLPGDPCVAVPNAPG